MAFHGRTLLHRVYGRTRNVKVGGGRTSGPGGHGGMVWEGVNTTSVVLAAGLASVTLTAHREDSSTCVPAWQAPAGTGPAECMYADRNIDAILLHPNRTDLSNRWASDVDTGVLAFDGLFSQAGEVFFRVTNHDTNSSAPPMALAVRPPDDLHLSLPLD